MMIERVKCFRVKSINGGGGVGVGSCDEEGRLWLFTTTTDWE